MARTSTSRRRKRENDSMDSLKPLIVLGLLGTILYGAYSVVQSGPAPQAPGVSYGDPPVAAPPVAPDVSFASESAPPPDPFAPARGSPIETHPLAGVEPLRASDALPAAPPPVAPPPAAAPPDLSALAPPPVVEPPATALPASSFPAAAAPTAAPAAPPSAAFAAAWSDAHDKLGGGRYAEALSALSVWYDDPALGAEESRRLEDLLGQLAGTVIYSQKDLLLPPYVVGPGETLQSIAAPLQVPWQLLGKINGVSDPAQLVQGEHLKVVRGPFDAVISVSRRRMSLQVGGNYAGSFPVVLGRQVHERVGRSVAVIDVRRPGASPEPPGFAAQVAYAPTVGAKAVILGDGLAIEGVEDPSLVADTASPSSVIVSLRDLEDIADILGSGSQVLVRR